MARKKQERSIVELLEGTEFRTPLADPEPTFIGDDDNQIPLDSLRTKSWGGGAYQTITDEGTGVWAPEKRAMVELHNLKNLLYNEPWVYIVCFLYAKKIARQPLTVVKESFRNGKRVYEPREDHPLLKSFRKPNGYETYKQFMQRLVAELMLMGNAILWRMEYAKGMMMLPTELIQLDFDNRQRLKGYRFLGSAVSEDIQLPGFNRSDFVFPVRQSIHFRLPNLNSMLWGLSPFIPGRRSVLFDRYSSEYLLNFYWNQGNHGAMLQMDKEANEANAVRLLKSYELAGAGRRNSRRTILLPKGVTVSNYAHKLAEQELAEHLQLKREEVLGLLHVPKHEVGIQTQGSLGSEEFKQALKNFWSAGILPTQDLIAEGLTEAWRATGDLADDEEFQFDNSDVEILQEDRKAKAETANAMLKTKTINEVRAEIWEDEPIEGGDVLEVEFLATVSTRAAAAANPQGLPGQVPPQAAEEEQEAPATPQDEELVDEEAPPAPAAPAAEEEAQAELAAPLDDVRPDENGIPPQRKEAAPALQVATLALFAGGKLLMGTRRDNGRWTCPGGHLEPGEDPVTGVLRETKEETGLELTADQVQAIGQDEVTGDDGTKRTIYAFRAELPEQPEVTTGDDPDGEITKWAWVKTEGGLPAKVRENLHVPMQRNVLMQAAELKGSAGYLRTNKLWFTKREKAAETRVGTDQEKVLTATLDLLGKFAGAAVKVAKRHLEGVVEKAKAEGDDQKLPRRAQIRRDLDRAFDKFQEGWVDENVKTLTGSADFGYDLQLQVPFNIPDRQEVEQLRKRNAEGRSEQLAARQLKSFSQISATTSDQIMGVIADGLEKSLTLQQIAGAITEKIASVENAGHRAMTIARTEVLGAVSLGQWAAMQDAEKVMPGSEVMWVSAGDARVRDSHAAIDGQKVKMGAKFDNGLMFPRDPAGSAEEVINCRCTFLMVPPEDGDKLDDSGIEWTGKQ